MSLNWQEIDLAISEWRIDGAQIQNLSQPDFFNLYLEFYQPGRVSWLHICLQAGLTRMHLVDPPPRTKLAQARFGEFLRSHIKGGVLLSVQQLGQERIVCFAIQTPEETLRLYVRLWGNAANILVVDHQNKILDAFYRRPLKAETSGDTLVLPPVREMDASSRERFPIRAWQNPGEGGFNRFLFDQYRNLSGTLQVQGMKDRLVRQSQAALLRLEGRLQSLQRQSEQNANPERFKQIGEILLAFKQQIRRGEHWFQTDDWYNPGTSIRIELDPKLDVGTNAERYFQKYHKAKDGRRYLDEELSQVRANMLKVRELASLVQLSEEHDALEELASRLSPYLETNSGKNSRIDSPRPGLSFESHGFPVFIGRTVLENDELLRRHVKGNDWWLHVRDYPGGYVFIKVPKTKTVPLEVLLDAAHLAIWYSRAKQEPEVDLFYTQVKYLRRAKHGTYGMVIPTRERNLHVVVEAERHARLAGILNQDGQ